MRWHRSVPGRWLEHGPPTVVVAVEGKNRVQNLKNEAVGISAVAALLAMERENPRLPGALGRCERVDAEASNDKRPVGLPVPTSRIMLSWGDSRASSPSRERPPKETARAMTPTVIYDITQDSWELVRCAIPLALGLLIWSVVKVVGATASDKRVKARGFIARTVVLVVTTLISSLLAVQQLDARTRLMKHDTLEACGILHGFIKSGRDGLGERFYIGPTMFVTNPYVWSAGLNNSLALSKWVDGGPIRAVYIPEGSQNTILRLTQTPGDCPQSRPSSH